MKKEFKLEKVLDYRNTLLDEEKMKMTKLNNEAQALAEHIASIEQEIIAQQQQRLEDANAGALSFAEMYDKYIKVKEQELTKTIMQQNKLKQAIDKQREVLNKALADVKIIQKLKDKHLLAYKKYIAKREALEVDEINTIKQRNEI